MLSSLYVRHKRLFLFFPPLGRPRTGGQGETLAPPSPHPLPPLHHLAAAGDEPLQMRACSQGWWWRGLSLGMVRVSCAVREFGTNRYGVAVGRGGDTVGLRMRRSGRERS